MAPCLSTRSAFSDHEGKFARVPDVNRAIEYLGYTKLWEELCAREVEKFGGDTILINEDRMKKADRQLRKWIELTNRLLARHPSAMSSEVNADHHVLTVSFEVRFTRCAC